MSGPVDGCPQRDDTPERVRAYTPEQIATRDSAMRLHGILGIPMSDALARAEAQAEKIHAAWEVCRNDD